MCGCVVMCTELEVLMYAVKFQSMTNSCLFWELWSQRLPTGNLATVSSK
uniref:Uncharacterized protein n=1 Tax=Anguilla anguilla TaxID=7936 RepID=A0A0E9PQ20_ANGAN